ncbi:MAG: hypothetical protein KatS3mg033_2330 [Thermonema sp.]|uniref:tetratricopeptide repeat protein n=1 Tax=Thermonema sp. TaxID=2231181 RepID=UPI0021DCDC02|nr:tetratricopeptide repeat protein [Thermonema sp.]GIV40530.1 MAG: hypothetical protein KatS3mg033_2330 [Thermonema sp.]
MKLNRQIILLVWLLCWPATNSRAQHNDARQAALMAMYEGDYKQAIQYYEQSLIYDNDKPEMLWGLARSHFYAGNYPQAVQVCRQLLQNKKSAWKCRATLLEAFCYFRMADSALQQRIEKLQAAQECMPQDYRTHFYLGLLYMQNGQLSEAETAFKQALALRPKQGGLWIALGNLYATQEQWSEAANCWCQAAELPQAPPAAVYNCAKLLLRSGSYERGLQMMERYAQNHPLQADDYFDVARACAAGRQYEEALRYIAAAIQLAPQQGVYYAVMADYHAALLQWDAALYANSQAILKQGEETTYFIQRAQLLLNAGRDEEAKAYLEFWIQQEPDNAQAHYAHALWLMRNKGKRRQIKQAVKEAVRHGMHPQDMDESLQKYAYRHRQRLWSAP